MKILLSWGKTDKLLFSVCFVTGKNRDNEIVRNKKKPLILVNKGGFWNLNIDLK